MLLVGAAVLVLAAALLLRAYRRRPLRCVDCWRTEPRGLGPAQTIMESSCAPGLTCHECEARRARIGHLVKPGLLRKM